MRILAFLAVLALSGCMFVHKIDVQQGNFVTQDVVARLKKGMTKSEVRQLLGTPLLIDAFHANRWDYFFSQVQRGKAQERTRLSVFFEDDKLVAVTGDVRPGVPGQPATAAGPDPAAAAAPKPAPLVSPRPTPPPNPAGPPLGK